MNKQINKAIKVLKKFYVKYVFFYHKSYTQSILDFSNSCLIHSVFIFNIQLNICVSFQLIYIFNVQQHLRHLITVPLQIPIILFIYLFVFVFTFVSAQSRLIGHPRERMKQIQRNPNLFLRSSLLLYNVHVKHWQTRPLFQILSKRLVWWGMDNMTPVFLVRLVTTRP